MDVTASILEYMLQLEGLRLRVLGNPECVVRRASLLRGHAKAADVGKDDAGDCGAQRPERGVAYIDLQSSCKTAPTAADGYVMLAPWNDCDGADVESVSGITLSVPACPDGKAMRHNAAMGSYGVVDTIETMNIANSVIAKLQSWDGDLKDAITANSTLADLAVLGQRIIPHEFSYIDVNLVMLMSSSDYAATMKHNEDGEGDAAPSRPPNSQGGSRTAGMTADTMLPQHVALDLIEEDRFEKASAEREPFYYERNDGTMVYCINTHADSRYLARFVVRLLDGSRRLHPGEEALIIHFNSYIKLLYSRLASGSGSLSRQDDAFHRLLRSAGNSNAMISQNSLQSSIEPYGWRTGDVYAAMWFEFMDNVSWRNAGFYMACQLESQWPNSCAVTDGNGILWVLNRSMMPSEHNGSAFRKAFTKLLSDYVCKCGVSADFDDLCTLPMRWREARLALRYGSVHDASRWHYSFADYRLEHILENAVSELPPEQICSRKLLALVKHDEQRDTDYARTLVCYLRNDSSATRASDELFIHRTTLLRRLESIRKIAKFDFSNSDEKTFLLLSAKLLGI